eukprot:1332634-Amorphochlora_amoeboformis.AAC.1
MVEMCRFGLESPDPLVRKRAVFLLRARLALGVNKGLVPSEVWLGYLDVVETLEEHGVHLISNGMREKRDT